MNSIFVLILLGALNGQPQPPIVAAAFPSMQMCQDAVKEIQESELNPDVTMFGVGCIEVKKVVAS